MPPAIAAAILISTLSSAPAPGELIWSTPQLVATGSTEPYDVHALLIHDQPAFVYTTTRAADNGHRSITITERVNSQWLTSSVLTYTGQGDPMSLDAVVVNDVPYVAATRTGTGSGNDLKVVSRNGTTWQDAFSKHIDGGSGIGTVAITAKNGSISGVVRDNPQERELTVFGQTDLGWATSHPSFNLYPGIDNVSISTISGNPIVLASQQAGQSQLWLGTKASGTWGFSQIPVFMKFGELQEWNGRPAIVGRLYTGNKDTTQFAFLDAAGQWHQEPVSYGRTASWDLAVFGGVPMVAYIDARDPADTLRVAVRGDTGWHESIVATASSYFNNAIDLFDLNGRPAIAYADSRDGGIYLVTAVPEPSSVVPAAFALIGLFVCVLRIQRQRSIH